MLDAMSVLSFILGFRFAFVCTVFCRLNGKRGTKWLSNCEDCYKPLNFLKK